MVKAKLSHRDRDTSDKLNQFEISSKEYGQQVRDLRESNEDLRFQVRTTHGNMEMLWF